MTTITATHVLAEQVRHGQRHLRDLKERVGTEIAVDMPTRRDGSWTRVTFELTPELLAEVEAQIAR